MTAITELSEAFCLPEPNTESMTFTDWPTASKMGYATKTTFKFGAGLVPGRGEISRAIYLDERVFTRAEWRDEQHAQSERRHALADQTEGLERLSDFQRSVVRAPTGDGRLCVVLNSIPLYHRSQMVPGKFGVRTRAFIDFGNAFWRSSDSGNYIERNFDPLAKAKWWTRDRKRRKSLLEPFVFFSESLLKAHLSPRALASLLRAITQPSLLLRKTAGTPLSRGSKTRSHEQ